MARPKALTGFPLGIELSILLHIVVVLVLIGVWHIHGRGIALPPVNNPFDHAIAISLTPTPHPQPKPKVVVPTPPKPVPTPPIVESQAVQQPLQAPPPDLKTPPQPPQQVQQTEAQANPDYQSMAEAILDHNKRYPREAVLAGTEGQVVLQFVVNNQGTVLGYTIEKSSGSDALDHEVVRMLHVSRFPPFPTGDNSPRKTLDVTIEFKLGGTVQP